MNGFDLIIQPDEDDPEAAEVLVDATIGSRNYRFLLDTGAAMTCISYDDYTSTFESVGARDTTAAFSKSSQELVVVPSITLGSLSRRNFMVARRPPHIQTGSNLIGMNLLKDHSLSFYFDKNRVEVDSKPGNETGNSSQELILGNKSHPNVNINFGELETRAVWDTGAGITVVDTRFINSHPAFFQEAGTSTGTDSTGAMSSTPMFVMQGATIGGRRFAPTKVAAIDLAPIITSTDIRMDLILGYNLIKEANWLFDFPRKKWSFLGS